MMVNKLKIKSILIKLIKATFKFRFGLQRSGEMEWSNCVIVGLLVIADTE